MIYIDTDNALGGPRGDVDDAFAITAVLSSNLSVCGIGSVFGNAAEPVVAANNRTLGELLDYSGPFVRGAAAPAQTSDAATFLLGAPEETRVLALGPLTNVAAALGAGARSIGEVILVGANYTTKGRWPPVWPFEFNLTHDRAAARRVFDADVGLTVVPLDVARRLRASRADLESIPGSIGDYLRTHSRRWARRSLWVRARTAFPVWDLVAAVYAIEPSLFEVVETTARAHDNAWIEFGVGERAVRVVTGYDSGAVWSFFLQLVNEAEHSHV